MKAFFCAEKTADRIELDIKSHLSESQFLLFISLLTLQKLSKILYLFI